MNITYQDLKDIAPIVKGSKSVKQEQILCDLAKCINPALQKFKINTGLRVAHFLAQIAHESDGFCTLEEYADGSDYEGRKDLGNTEKGDGKRFKGRGLIQLTGRDNHLKVGNAIGVNLIDDPDKAATVEIGIIIAAHFWHSRKLNKLADQNKLKKITRRINGGYNGLKDRKRYFKRAKNILEVSIPPKTNQAIMKLGSMSDDVKTLQIRLNKIQYYIGVEDGHFGTKTDDQTRAFQRDYKLTIDGKVKIGGETWTTLASAVTQLKTRKVTDIRKTKTALELANDGSRIASASVRGAGVSIAAAISAGGLALTQAAEVFGEHKSTLTKLLEPFGGASNLLIGVLVLGAAYSAYQHIKSARARTEDHQRGKTA